LPAFFIIFLQADPECEFCLGQKGGNSNSNLNTILFLKFFALAKQIIINLNKALEKEGLGLALSF